MQGLSIVRAFSLVNRPSDPSEVNPELAVSFRVDLDVNPELAPSLRVELDVNPELALSLRVELEINLEPAPELSG